MILSLRLTLALVAILVMALALTVLLSYFQFRTTLGQLLHSRIAAMTLDMQRTLENLSDLGLDLKTYCPIQTIIDRVHTGDAQILSISVFDQRGQILFDTAFARNPNCPAAGRPPPPVGQENIPAAWRLANSTHFTPDDAPTAAGRSALWRSAGTDAFVVGATLVNNFNQLSGGVALRYSQKVYWAKLDQVRIELISGAFLVFASFFAQSVLVVFIFFNRLLRSSQRMEQALTRLLHNRRAPPPPPASALEQDFVVFHQCTEEAIAALTEAERKLNARR